jgi:hypothetical protein
MKESKFVSENLKEILFKICKKLRKKQLRQCSEKLNKIQSFLSPIVQIGLKGQCYKIFRIRLFHESSSPNPLKITLGSFRIFSKIRGDIRKSRCTIRINDLVNLKENIYLYVNSTTPK